MNIRTKYYLYNDQRVPCEWSVTRELVYRMRLESIVDGWHACKKEHGLWVVAHSIIHHKCPSCGHNYFEIRWNKPSQRNIKVAECQGMGCDERIEFDSYKVPTPDQAVGVWKKVDGKWCAKIISGIVGDEVIMVSKKGAQLKKTKSLKIVK